METKAQLQSIDQLSAIATAIDQTLVMLLESGPAFSALSASHVSSEPDDGAIVFEDCKQVRIESDGTCVGRSFSRVSMIKDSKTDYWIASPDDFESYFSQPSLDPYAIIQLSEDDAREYERLHRDSDFESAFEFLRERFGSLPRFYSPTETKFCAPENYATGREAFSDVRRFL